jgi:hypothetical protein
MKSSRIKRVVVKGVDWEDIMDIDSEIHDDFLIEAATRSLEKRKKDPNLKVSMITTVWEERNKNNPMKHFGYNSYLIMVNASMHTQAEYLRGVYLKQKNMDLRDLKLRGDENGTGPTTTGTESTNN